MLVTTTPSIDGYRVTHYLGVVSGEAILGADIFKDFFAGIRDVVGGRAAAYEQQLREAKQIAFGEMTGWAAQLGANGVIGVDLDYETIGGSGTMLMVSASGTAVYVMPNAGPAGAPAAPGAGTGPMGQPPMPPAPPAAPPAGGGGR
jgi:uncharacterized protein YbjQ (UPF0145 family)